MSNPFVLLYRLFETRKKLFYTLLFSLSLLIVLISLKLKLKEDITAFIPKDEKAKRYQEVVKNLKVNDRVIFNISLKDSTISDPDLLTAYADALADSIRSKYDTTWISEINYKIEEDQVMVLFDLLFSELPYYLNEDDYSQIEKNLSDSLLKYTLQKNYETILSPEGAVLKNFIIKDPLGLNNYGLKKLTKLKTDENFELYNGYFLTKNKKNLFVYLSIAYPANDGRKNQILVEGLSEITTSLKEGEYKSVNTEFFGSPVISVANVRQIKKDSILTTVAALVIILGGLLLYFRNLKTVLLIFLPVAFGAGFALALITILKSEISAIAIGAGSIVLGIAINYSLHFFTHLKHEGSVVKVISDLTVPLTLGCTTTIGAFLCLYFMQSEALQDMGLFSAFSLLGAAFCCLVVLPLLVKSYEKISVSHSHEKLSWFDKIAGYSFHKNKFMLVLVIGLTVLFAFNYDKVGFETDMTKLSYIPPELEQTENNLDKITNYKLKAVFLVSEGKTVAEALKANTQATPVIKNLVEAHKIQKYSNPGEFILTDSLRAAKITQWKNFWTGPRVNDLKTRLFSYGKAIGFKETIFDNTFSLFTKEFDSKNDSAQNVLKKIILQDYVSEKKNSASIITILRVEQSDKPSVYAAFESFSNLFIIDRGAMATMFAKILSEDFNLILLLCSGLVFGFLFLSYGRIELAVLAFLPMLLSWIWILGFMGILGIKFNIVNIIICTFMFGLGDDFSIFTLDGLEQEYKYGKNVLASYRHSIFLSAFTVIVGIGVLIFAKHPALQSIALVTIVGIFCIVIISMIVQPLLYELLVLGRVRNRKVPITIYIVVFYLLSGLYFIPGLLVVSLVKLTGNRTVAYKFVKTLTVFSLFVERKFGDNSITLSLQKMSIKFRLVEPEFIENSYKEKRERIYITDYLRGKLLKNYIFKGPVVEWYIRIKTQLEDNYKVFHQLVPTQGKIVDVGCGYGYMTFMLNMAAPDREVTGIDYDEEKIAIAQSGVLVNSKVQFYHSDVLEYLYQPSDAFIISDVLHYLSEENQAVLIRKCLDKLNSGGVLIIRDGNSEMKERHKGTKLTELFSTKIIGFNKVTIDELCFTSKEKILSIVSSYPVTVEILDNTQYTSNIIFIIRKNN